MKVYWLILLIPISSSALGATLYRSTAEDGTVSYSDRPLDDSAELLRVAVTPTALAPIEEETETEDGELTLSDAVTPEVSDELTVEELAERNAENCTASKDQLAYVRREHIYRSLPNGEVEEIVGAERTEIRARAQAEVDRWCD